MQTRIVLFEVHRVIDHQRVEGVDLLDGGVAAMTLVDRSLAVRALRFGTLLGWAFPLPHFWRLSGNAVSLSDLGPFTPSEILAETVRHLGGSEPGKERRRWLAEHFGRVEKSITATANERLRRMYEGMDALWGHANYELAAPYADCLAALDREPAVESAPLEDSERTEKFMAARHWFDDSPVARALSPGQGWPLLGTVLLRKGTWRVEASTGARLDRMRQLFERRLGARVRFVSERRDNLGVRLAERLPVTGGPDLIPPRLLESIESPALSIASMPLSAATQEQEMSTAFLENQWKTFADEPVPGLDGRTPREAARDAALRPRLIQLMKSHVRILDGQNLRTGASADINPLLRELGLRELDFPPPPRRARLPEEGDEEDEAGLFDDDEGAPRAEWPLLPPLPLKRPLTFDEAEARLQVAMGAFDQAGDALDMMAAAGSTLIDDLLAVTDGLIDEQDFNCLVPFVIPVWFALVPEGMPSPNIPSETLRQAIRRDLEAAVAQTKAIALPDKLINNRRQPEFTLCVMGHCINGLAKAHKQLRPKPAAQAAISLVLGTVIEELDRVVRG